VLVLSAQASDWKWNTHQLQKGGMVWASGKKKTRGLLFKERHVCQHLAQFII